MVWGGGLLAQWGVKDFAGGIVVHNIAGMAALASVLYVGRRRVVEAGLHSIPMVALGTGLLWFGWYGFNAGSQMRVDSVTAVAFLNTDLAASFAAIAWLIVAWIPREKAQAARTAHGRRRRTGHHHSRRRFCVARRRRSIGIAAGVVCYFAVELKNKLKWDDALDVWGVHGVGGMLGIILLGVFADQTFNPEGVNGLLHGNPGFLFKQTVAVVFSSVWAFGFTYAMLAIINRFTPVRVDASSETLGLDQSLHGERAYEEMDLIAS